MADQVLSLSTTEFDRPTVAIDGESYEMRAPEEMSVALLRAMQETLEDLDNVDEGSDIEDVASAIGKQLEIVMPDLPGDVKEKLTFGQQKLILETFRALSADGSRALSGETS